MDRLGCFFMTARTFGDLESLVLAAEELGYEAAGLPELAGRDAPATAHRRRRGAEPPYRCGASRPGPERARGVPVPVRRAGTGSSERPRRRPKTAPAVPAAALLSLDARGFRVQRGPRGVRRRDGD